MGVLRVALLCFLWLSAASMLRADEPDSGLRSGQRADKVLSRLEDSASSISTLETRFIQEKHLLVFEQPLILKGQIFIKKPSLFAWHVSEPLEYSMVTDGETLRQWDEDTNRVQKISLSKNPAFSLAIRQMKDWLSGSYKSMLAEYEVVLLSEDPVSLEFTPHETALSHDLIRSVTIHFGRDERYIQQVIVHEKSGDRTVLRFVDAVVNTTIEPSAWKVGQHVR